MAQNPHRHGSGSDENNRRPPEEKEIASAINALQRSFEATNEHNQERAENGFVWTRRTAIAAFIYTGLTAAILVFSGYVALKTGESVDVATRQANNLEISSKQQLRAYVGVIPGAIVNFGDKENQTFSFTIKNFGLTPAYDVFVQPRLPEGIAASQIIATSPNIPPTFTGTLTLFPGADHPQHIVGSPVPSEFNQLIKTTAKITEPGAKLIVYAGIVFYKEVSGKQHYTRYCWQFLGQSMTREDADGCLGHNDSD